MHSATFYGTSVFSSDLNFLSQFAISENSFAYKSVEGGESSTKPEEMTSHSPPLIIPAVSKPRVQDSPLIAV